MWRILYDLYGRHRILCTGGTTSEDEDDGELEHEWLAANPVEGQLNPSASLLPECGNNMPFLELFDKRT